MSPTIKETKFFVQQAHKGQHDKQGRPYYEHLFAVEKLLPKLSPRWMRHAALLHDLIKETKYTAKDLVGMGHDRRTVSAVTVLTHLEGETYAAYLHRVSGAVNGVLLIKIAALTHNMDLTRAKLPGPQRWEYERAKEQLESVLKNRE